MQRALCGKLYTGDAPMIMYGKDQGQGACWCPAADIYRTRTGWLIKYDLAGVAANEIKVTIVGSSITVSGIRRDWRLEDGARHYSMEISYNRFERTVELPCDLSGAKFALQGREGILLLRLTCQGENP